MTKWTKWLIGLLMLVMITAFSVGASAGQDVKFTWSPYTDPDPIDGFHLYMAAAPGVAAIPANLVATITGKASISYTQLAAPAGQRYWVLTAYQANPAAESGPSNEVNLNVQLRPPGDLSPQAMSFTFNKTKVTVERK